MPGTSCALPGPGAKLARSPRRGPYSKPLRKSPADQEMNSNADLLSLCDPTFITGEAWRPSELSKLIQIICARHPAHHKSVSS